MRTFIKNFILLIAMFFAFTFNAFATEASDPSTIEKVVIQLGLWLPLVILVLEYIIGVLPIKANSTIAVILSVLKKIKEVIAPKK